MDPRPGIVGRRLEGVKRILAVSGGKGGIGKSSIASVLALWLAGQGLKVGLLDLDFSGPSDHVFLGAEGLFPSEDKGLIPPDFHGLKFMSIVYFSGNNPTALRGHDISNAIIEMLAVTIWDDLDFLIMDMPPGISDATLDVVRLIDRLEYLVVTIPSRMAREVGRKELRVLQELNIPVVGVIENMRRVKDPATDSDLEAFGVPVLGRIRFDGALEDALGDPRRLLETRFAKAVGRMARNLTAS